MEEWKEYTLEDVGKITTGKTPKTANKDFFGGAIHFITPADLNTAIKYIYQTERCLSESGMRSIITNSIKKGSVCVSCIGNIGYTGIATMDCATNQQINSITVNETFDRDYIYYAIKNLWVFFKNYEGQSTTLSILNKGQFSKLLLKLPTLDTQKRIGSILSSFDDKIEVNKRINDNLPFILFMMTLVIMLVLKRKNDNLEQQAQALFKSWFVDFEPFKDGEFVESELGMIPKGWRVYRLDEITETISGYSYKGEELVPSNIAMATIKSFARTGGFKEDGYKEIIPSPRIKGSHYLNLFDIIVAHTDITQNADIIGNPAIILSKSHYDSLIMSMDLSKVVSKSPYITYGLMYTLLSDSRFKNHALGYVNGTTVLHMSKKAVPDYRVALPEDLSIIHSVCEVLNSLFERESNNLQESHRLSILRDTLLPRLMSGKLKVNELDN